MFDFWKLWNEHIVLRVGTHRSATTARCSRCSHLCYIKKKKKKTVLTFYKERISARVDTADRVVSGLFFVCLYIERISFVITSNKDVQSRRVSGRLEFSVHVYYTSRRPRCVTGVWKFTQKRRYDIVQLPWTRRTRTTARRRNSTTRKQSPGVR